MLTQTIIIAQRKAVTSHLPHEDLSPADEHRGAGDVEPLLQPLQIELLHLLVAALHFHRVEGEHGQPLHVLRGRRIEEGNSEQNSASVSMRKIRTKTENEVGVDCSGSVTEGS